MSRSLARTFLLAGLFSLTACSRTDIFGYMAASEVVTISPASVSVELTRSTTLVAAVTPTVSGAKFTWSLSPNVGTINANGVYTAPDTFPSSGETSLKITVTASLENLLSTPGTATITLVPLSSGPIASLVKVSGDLQTVIAGQPYPKPLVVEAEDASKVPVQGVKVSFVSSSGATFTVTTNTNGEATVLPTAGTTTGTETTIVSATGVPSLTFTATVGPGPLTTMTATDTVSAGIIGEAVTAPLNVLFQDQYGNPIPGRTATVVVPVGGAAVPLAAQSDATGVQAFTITLGTSVGSQTFRFTDSLLTTISTTFTFNAEPAGPAALLLVSGGNQSAAVDTALTNQILLEVVDFDMNPVSGVTVNFTLNPTAAEGGGSLNQTTAVTGTNGLVSVLLTTGTLAGTQQVIADAGSITGSPMTITETALAGPVAKLTLVAGNGQTTTPGQAFLTDFTVHAQDKFQNPISGLTVTFSAQTGGGAVVPVNGGVTASNGNASTQMIAGPAGGAETFMASVTSLTGVAPVIVHETSSPPVTKLVPISGNGQSANPGTKLPEPLVVEALGANGQPVPNATITFTAPTGASVAPATVTTNAKGEAQVTATLGRTAGVETFVATSGTATASFTEVAGNVVSPLSIEIVSGNDQSGAVDAALTKPLVVEVVDGANAQPVPGVTITWTTTSGATITGGTVTGANGEASATVTLGATAEIQQIQAGAGHITNSPVTFSETATAGGVTQLVLVAGNQQSTTTGSKFGAAFSVEAEDDKGNPVEGVIIDFTVGAAGGSIAPAHVTTDANGVAQATMTAGAATGKETFTATVSTNAMLTVTVTETVTATGKLKIVVVSGGGQTGTVGTTLANPLVVEVTQDPAGTPVAGVQVTFGVAAGDGSIAPQTVPTGANGRAEAQATLGTLAGAEVFSASIADSDGTSPVHFDETATGAVATLVIVSGNGQTSNPEAALPQPLVVEAVSSTGQAVSGVVVTFTPPAGGSVSKTTVTTGADGLAQVTGTLGPTVGTQTFVATDTTSSVTFDETASTVTTGLVLSIVSGSGQSGLAGTPLGSPLVVEVTDNGGGPVSGVTITWTAQSGGSVQPASTPTTADGQASANATLGSAVGVESFTAACANCQNSPVTFTETVNAGPPTQIVIVSGNGQTGTISDALPAPLVVEVEDANNNPVAGVTVTFASATGGGSIAPTSVQTGSNGQASATATLGPQPGPDTFTATASVGSVTFTATANGQIQSISVSPTNAQLAQGASQQYTATALYQNGAKADITNLVTWSSTNTMVGTIIASGSGAGLLDAVGPGTSTIQASYSGLTGSATVTVNAATLNGIVVTPVNASIFSGSTQQFVATGQYSNGSISTITGNCAWSSTTTSVATISSAAGSAGLASAVGQGSTTIACVYQGVTGSTTLTVTTAPIETLQITPTFASGSAGGTISFTATATFEDGTVQNVTSFGQWSSSDDSLMTLQNTPAQAGLATLIAAGTPDVIVTYDGLTAQESISISAATIVSLTVTPQNDNLPEDETQQYTAQAVYSNGTVANVTDAAAWTSSETGVASVSNAAGSAGLVSTVSSGTTTITASFDGQTASTSLTVNSNTARVLRVFQGNPSPFPGGTTVTCNPGQTEALQCGAVLFGGGMPQIQFLTTQCAWTTSNATVAIVGNGTTGGEVQCLATGSATITAEFEGQEDNATVNVTNGTVTSITIAPTSLTLPKGTFQALNATATYSDGTTETVTDEGTWSSANDSFATASNASGTQGQVTGVAIGMTTVTISFGGQTASVPVTVTAAVLTNVIIAPADPSLMYQPVMMGGGGIFPPGMRNPDDFYETATALFSDGSESDVTSLASWSTSNPDVAVVENTITTEGMTLEATGTGTCQLIASYSGITGQTTFTSF